MQRPAVRFSLRLFRAGHTAIRCRSSCAKGHHRALSATYADHRVHISKTDAAVIHLYLTGDQSFQIVEEGDLKEDVLAICSPWNERLHTALNQVTGEEESEELASRYSALFSDAYKSIRSVEQAVTDIQALEEVNRSGKLGFDLLWEDTSSVQLVLYEPQNIFLTDILPILDHFGLRVREQEAFTLRGASPHVIDSFFIEIPPFRGESIRT